MEDVNANVMAIVLHEIDIITKEQVMLVKLHDELEDRRIRLIEFLQTSDKLEISEGSRENLLKNVSDMKITMSNSSAQGEKQEKFKRK